MPKIVVLYPTPTDVAVYEARFAAEHVPLARAIPGVTSYVAARVLGSPLGAAPYQRVVTLNFASMETLQAAAVSAEGQAAMANAMEISSGGMPCMLIAEDDITF